MMHTMKVYDVTGREVQEAQEVTGQRIVIQRMGLLPGVYLVRLSSYSGEGVLKLIVR